MTKLYIPIFKMYEAISDPKLYFILTIISEVCGVFRVYPVFYVCKVSVDMVREIQKIMLFSGCNINLNRKEAIMVSRKPSQRGTLVEEFDGAARHSYMVEYCKVKQQQSPVISTHWVQKEKDMRNEITLEEVLMNKENARRMNISVDELDIVALRPDEPTPPAAWEPALYQRGKVVDPAIIEVLQEIQEAAQELVRKENTTAEDAKQYHHIWDECMDLILGCNPITWR